MNTAKIYFDSKQNVKTIHQMVKTEPEWAANRIQEGEKAIELLELKGDCMDTESDDYTKAQNGAKITIALDTLRQVVCGDQFGVDKEELMVARKQLCRLEEKVTLS